MKIDYNEIMILCDKSCFIDLELETGLNVFNMSDNSTMISKLLSLLSIGYKNITVVVDDRPKNDEMVLGKRIEFIINFIGEYRKDNYKIINFSDYSVKKNNI